MTIFFQSRENGINERRNLIRAGFVTIAQRRAVDAQRQIDDIRGDPQ
jgi:hypothetical protein